MRCIACGFLASPAKSGRDLYGSLSLTLGIRHVVCQDAAIGWPRALLQLLGFGAAANIFPSQRPATHDATP